MEKVGQQLSRGERWGGERARGPGDDEGGRVRGVILERKGVSWKAGEKNILNLWRSLHNYVSILKTTDSIASVGELCGI